MKLRLSWELYIHEISPWVSQASPFTHDRTMVGLNGPHITEITGRCLELILSGYTEIAWIDAYVNT